MRWIPCNRKCKSSESRAGLNRGLPQSLPCPTARNRHILSVWSLVTRCWGRDVKKFLTIPLWFIAFLLVIAVGLYVWLTESPWLKNRLAEQLNQILAVSTDLHIDIGEMSGGLVSGVQFDDVSIIVQRGLLRDTLAHVDRIEVEYDIRNLVPKLRWINSVEIIHPVVWVPRDSIESLFRKAGYESTEKVGLGGALELTVNSILVRDGSIWRDGDTVSLADSISINASFATEEGTWGLAIAPSAAWSNVLGPVQFEGRLASHPSGIWCDSLRVQAGRSSFMLSGDLNHLQIRSSNLDLDQLSQVLPMKLTGQVELSGTIESNLDEKRASGVIRVGGTFQGYPLENLAIRFHADSTSVTLDSVDGIAAGARYRGMGMYSWSVHPPHWEYKGQVEGFDLSRLAEGVMPTQLSGHVDVKGIGVTNADLHVRAEVDLGPGRIRGLRIQSAHGWLGATVDSLWIAENFEAQWEGASLVGGGTIAFDDSIAISAAVRSSELHRLDTLVFVDSLGGSVEGYVYLSGLTQDPDLSAFVNSDSLRLFNLITNDFEARVFVPHFLSHPTGEIDARWGRASTWGVPTDSIELHGHLFGRRMDVDWARWYSPNVDVEGAGNLDWSTDTIPIALYPLTVRWENQTYSASDSVLVTVDSIGFLLSQFAFEGPLGILRATGRLGFDHRLALDFDVDRFRVAKVWGYLFPDWELDGIVAARGQLRGNLVHPEFEIAGDLSELEFEGTLYGDLEAGLSYQDHKLQVEWAELDNQYFHASASGSLPLVMSFQPPSVTVPEEPFSGRLEANGENLDPLSQFLPQTIESVHGHFSMQAGVAGTPRSPQFFGEASLTNGTIKAIEIVNPFEDVAIDVALRQDTVMVRHVNATLRDHDKSGKIDVTGMMRILSIKSFDYNLRVVGKAVPVRLEYKDLFAISDLDLTVTGATPPKVAGSVRPSKIEDREPFSEEETRPVYDTTLWDWDIAVEMPEGGYSIRNEQIEAELSADLRILRENGRLSYVGTTEIVRGKVYLFDKVGRISSGTLTFDDPTKPDPRLDLVVVFRIQQPRVETRTETVANPFVDLTLHIGGRASEPLIEPESPYTEQDVLLLLAAHTTSVAADSLGVTDPFTSRLKFAATGLVFSEVERLAARKLGLETLEINSGTNPLDASITVGRYFSPQLYLYGTSPIDAGSGQEVGFEYRLSRRMFLEGNRDKQNLYRLNLHLNWEY